MGEEDIFGPLKNGSTLRRYTGANGLNPHTHSLFGQNAHGLCHLYKDQKTIAQHACLTYIAELIVADAQC